jgi:thioester reductase-like protein
MQERFLERITIIQGDLSEQLFGLSPSAFCDIANNVEVIFHNGACVNASYSYSNLKATNVLGTQEILRLAATGRTKPVHYVSTLSVLSPVYLNDSDHHLAEHLLFDKPTRVIGGYAQSKWVAEKLLHLGYSRGIPYAVYRPTLISGSTLNGASNSKDSLNIFIDACLELGCVPELDVSINMLPVDYISKGIVNLSLGREVRGLSYNFFNPRSINLRSIGDCIISMNLASATRIPFSEWLSHCSANSSTSNVTILSSLTGKAASPEHRRFTLSNAVDILEEEGYSCPAITNDLLERYVNWRFLHRNRQ